MILWVWDRFRKLSHYHYRMIMATILVPVIWTVAFNYFEVDCWGASQCVPKPRSSSTGFEGSLDHLVQEQG